ncbi:MAG: hypothetical protein F6K32_11250 [Desertifilum sp. SIO1I2]|nr:hypothetical protein [Desertifilum sp. SIO1I2]
MVLAQTLKVTKKHASLISLASLTCLSFAFAFILLRNQVSRVPVISESVCQQIVKEDAAVTPSQISQLQGKEGVEKASIRQALGSPYCILPKTSIRSGVITEREAYQTDDKGRLIIAYESDRYLGYGLESSQTGGFWPFSTSKTFRPNLKQIDIKEIWENHSGQKIAGYPVVGGLGDISLEYRGNIVAPLGGEVEGNFVLATETSLVKNTSDCVLYSTPQQPGYLLKLCGLKERNSGDLKAGETIGKTDGLLHLSLLTFRRSSNERPQWIYVSPSTQIIASVLSEN